MKIKLDKSEFNKGLEKLKKEYKVLAPVSLEYKGTYSDTDSIRYMEVSSIDEMNFTRESDYSPKEAVFPTNQVLFYFTEKEVKESEIDNRKILIFLKACDVNGIKRLDQIYLGNGEEQDHYYKILKDKVRYAVVGCSQSYRNCFCVSMDSNKTDDYAMGLNIYGNEIQLEIKDDELNVFSGEDCDFEIDFVKENLISLEIPDVDKLNLAQIVNHDMWTQYNGRCIACGRCNYVCPTCSCYTMQDVYYMENKRVGERRRVWAGCHVDGFSTMAGGHEFRTTKGDRMRFKALHKVYDFKKRFGYNMCVGCGRCDDVCPQYISFSSCIERITDIVNKEEK